MRTDSGEVAAGNPAPPAVAEPAGSERSRPGIQQWLPWEGKARPADMRCWAALSLSGLYYLAVLPFKPALLGSFPLLLTLLTGSTTGIVTSSAFARVGEFPLFLVPLAAIPGLMKFDLIYWWAGRLWGRRVLTLFTGAFTRRRRRMGKGGEPRRRRSKLGERAERLCIRFAWLGVILSYYLPVPAALALAIAGWSGMSWRRFLVYDLIGTVLWVVPLIILGYTIGQPAVDLANTVSQYALWITIGLVILLIAAQIWRTRGYRDVAATSGERE